MTRTHKGWTIIAAYPPIPVRDFDWSATSPDYDCDCDQDGFHLAGGQIVHAASYEALLVEIDAAIADGDDA